ncbi:MAG: hypothetical protein LBR29_02850 [Methylobacteriaceae bacterium]|nr:hypothetical protein [Methylobacteriaceae bacterium]
MFSRDRRFVVDCLIQEALIMSSVSFGLGNVVAFPRMMQPQLPSSARQKIDRKMFLDIVHSSPAILLNPNDQAARTYAIRFCVLGLVQIEEEQDDKTFRFLKPSEAFYDKGLRRWRVSRRSGTDPARIAGLRPQL